MLPMIREAIERLVAGESVGEDDAAAVMDEIMTGGATEAQLAAFLVALRIKGETKVVWPSSIKTIDPVLPLPKGHAFGR